MTNNNINQWFANFGMNVILKYKFVFFVLIIGFFVLGKLGSDRIIFNSANETFLPENDPAIVENDLFKEIFGNEEFAFIFIEADEIFDYDVLTYINKLTKDIEDNLPFVRDVTSITNIEYSDAREDILYIDDLIGEHVPNDSAELAKIKKKALSSKIYVNRIITDDSKCTGIAVNFTRIPEVVYAPVSKGFTPLDEEKWHPNKVIMANQIYTKKQADQLADMALNEIPDPRKLIAPALKVILGRHENRELKVLVTGIPIIDYEAEIASSKEGSKFGLIALVVSILLLIIIFRSIAGVFAPFIVIISTIVMTFGFTGWVNIPATMMSTMIVPLLLVVISVSYSIHMVNHFKNNFRKTGLRQASVKYSYEHAAWPCFLTAFTTAIGFASFIIVPLKPISQLGIVCSVGTFIAYVMVMLVVPPFFSFGKDKETTAETQRSNDLSHSLSKKFADFVINKALAIGLITVIIVPILIFFTFKVQVNTDTYEMMGDKLDFIRDSQYIVKRLGGLYSYEVMIELPEEGMAKSPEALKAIESISQRINRWESTTMTGSINDVLKDLNMSMHNKNEAYFTVPQSQELIAQYLLLYEMSGGENVEDWVDYDYKYLRLSVQTDKATTALIPKFAEIKQMGQELFPEGTKVMVTGDIPILFKMIQNLSVGQIKSIFVALCVITVIMMLILKSVKIGLISMIPNALPVVAITGFMGLVGFPIDLITVMIAPMIIGIAVDDTVHFIVHFKQDYEKLHTYREANRITFLKVGKAIVFTSVILTIGFSIFGLSDVRSLFNMGVLSCIGIGSALLADLFITPILFVFLKPFGK